MADVAAVAGVKLFRYSALTSAGDLVRGELTGTDAASIIAHLHEQALLPIEAAERTTAPVLRFPTRRAGPLPGRELALTSQQLARLLKAGVPLDRALAILVDLVEGRRMGRALRRTLDRVRDGAALAEAMGAQGKAFPQAYVSLVRAGELSGALHAVMARLAEFLVRSEAMRQKVVSALIYPIILIVVAVLSVGLVLTAVLPQFEPMFRETGSRLPSSTRIVMAAGDALREDWWVILLVIASFGMAWSAAMRSPVVVAERDRVMLAIPVIRTLVSRFEIGRFCRTLGVMLANGVAAPTALALCGATIGNRAIATAVADAATRFKEGEGLSGPLARTGRFPSLSIQLIRIGEETGKLDDMLGEIADIYDQDVQRALDRLMSMLVPALTIVTGLLIAFIVTAIMTAMIGLNDLVS